MKRFPWWAVLLLVWISPAVSGELVVGSLVDLTGMTRTVGKPYAEGVAAYAEWINGKGGVNGKPVRLVQIDYGYRVADAVEAYKRFRDVEGVLAVQGWGTADTEFSDLDFKPSSNNTAWACCPFHTETTASFQVNYSLGTWRCFGSCQEGGGIFDFY